MSCKRIIFRSGDSPSFGSKYMFVDFTWKLPHFQKQRHFQFWLLNNWSEPLYVHMCTDNWSLVIISASKNCPSNWVIGVRDLKCCNKSPFFASRRSFELLNFCPSLRVALGTGYSCWISPRLTSRLGRIHWMLANAISEIWLRPFLQENALV